MSTHPVEDLRLEMSTLFLQTDEKIGMYAEKIDTLSGTVTNMGVELNNIDETLSLYVTKTDSINKTVTDIGIKLDGVDESLTLYAKKTDVSGLKTEMEAAIKVNADNINLKVSKDSIISSINQTAETIKINASRLNLNGFVTFSMFDLSTQNTIKDKVSSGDLGSMAWKDGVSSDDLSWALSQEISNKVNLTTLNNTLLGYTKSGSITKEDLADALQAELTGKITGSASTSAGKLASVIINGQTLVAGGYLQTELINVDNLYATSLAAVRGTIGGFSIDDYQLKSSIYDSGGTFLYNLYINSKKGEIGLDGSSTVTYKLSGGYDYGNGSTALYIRKDLAATKMEGPRQAIKIKAINIDNVTSMIDLECEKAYTDGMTFLHCKHGIRFIDIGTKHFSNDSSGIWRTTLRLGLMPSVTQVNTESTSGARYNVKWDSVTGLIYIE